MERIQSCFFIFVMSVVTEADEVFGFVWIQLDADWSLSGWDFDENLTEWVVDWSLTGWVVDENITGWVVDENLARWVVEWSLTGWVVDETLLFTFSITFNICLAFGLFDGLSRHLFKMECLKRNKDCLTIIFKVSKVVYKFTKKSLLKKNNFKISRSSLKIWKIEITSKKG